MAGAVHGLEAVFGVVKLHGRVHIFSVVDLMAGDLPELAAHDVRGIDELVATANALIAHPVFHGLADEAAFGMPEDEAGTGDFLNGEEVKLLAEDAVVARLDLFQAGEVGLEVLIVEEGGAVDALELRVVLIAEPVGTGYGHDLEGFDAAGGGDVGATAEVGEGAVAVEGDFFAGLGELFDEVDLHEFAVAVVLGETFFAGFDFADEGFIAGYDFSHALFNGGKVFVAEGGLAVDVVEEALIGSGAVAEFGFGKELEDGGGHDVGGGVADDFEGGLVSFLEEPEFDVLVERGGEVYDFFDGGVEGGVVHGFGRVCGGVVGAAFGLVDVETGRGLDARDHDDGGEAGGDGGGDLERRGAAGDFADAAVGELDPNAGVGYGGLYVGYLLGAHRLNRP